MYHTSTMDSLRHPFTHVWPILTSTWMLFILRLFRVLGGLGWSDTVSWLSDVPYRQTECINRQSIRLLRSDDREWSLWWETAGKLLTRQLHHAGYTDDAQERSLDFFRQKVLPYLGALSTPTSLRRWKSFMTDDHTPLELSWDWGNGSKAPRVRYSIDPVSLDSGTQKDPSNLFTTIHFYENVIRRIPGVNLVWHDYFARRFEAFEAGLSERDGRRSRVFYAFDIRNDGDTVPKAYFFPRSVIGTTASEVSVWSTVKDAIKNAPSTTPGNLEALDVLSAFFKEQPKSTIEMLSIDLLDPQASRIKVYFRSRDTTCENLARNMTLNHRIKKTSHLQGVEDLVQLWKRLFNLSEGGQVGPNAHATAGVLYYTDFRLGDAMPKIKVYVPVRHYVANDEKVVSTLTNYLEDIGRDQFTGAYREMLKEGFSPMAMKDSRGLHTYMGCSISADGALQLISYINPQMEKMLSTAELEP